MKQIDIELNACNVIIDEIKSKGFCRVARVQNCIEKVKRRLNIDLVESNGVLRFKDKCENVWCRGGKVFIDGKQNICYKCKQNQISLTH